MTCEQRTSGVGIRYDKSKVDCGLPDDANRYNFSDANAMILRARYVLRGKKWLCGDSLGVCGGQPFQTEKGIPSLVSDPTTGSGDEHGDERRAHTQSTVQDRTGGLKLFGDPGGICLRRELNPQWWVYI